MTSVSTAAPMSMMLFLPLLFFPMLSIMMPVLLIMFFPVSAYTATHASAPTTRAAAALIVVSSIWTEASATISTIW